MDWILDLDWQRLWHLPMSAWIALGPLAFSIVMIGSAAMGSLLRERYPPLPGTVILTPRKNRFGLKAVVLVLIALLPGGLVGAAAIHFLLGKKNWRGDSILILAVSLIPGLFLTYLLSGKFPFPEVAHNFMVRGSAALAFGVMQLWIMAKLLREVWGEPHEKVSWWPALAWILQLVVLAGAVILIVT